MTRRTAVLSVPLTCLMDVVIGKTVIKLPKEVPEDAIYVYSWIEPDTQLLKIVLEHESFEKQSSGTYHTTHKAILEPSKKETPESIKYDPKSLIDAENFSRYV